MTKQSNITVTTGDLLESHAQTLVNTVNCVGVMGKGIALAFKQNFPDMYADYEHRCQSKQVHLGEPYLYKRVTAPWILNFPTKDHWRSVSKLDDIAKGLDFLTKNYSRWGIESIAVPPLGCGNGQLEWTVVGPTIYRGLSKLEIPVMLYAPYGTPKAQLSEDFLAAKPNPASANVSKLNPGLLALVGVVSRICNERYHWPLNRIALQKIAYFLTELGIPTGLHYQRGSFGPFSPELKKAVATLENHQLVSEKQFGRSFQVSPGPTYKDARAVYLEHLKSWAPQIERVADLFLRLQAASDMEIAATAYFVAKEMKLAGEEVSERAIFNEVLDWKKRRRPPLNEEAVAENIRSLNLLGWITAEISPDLPIPEEHFV